MGHVGDKFGRKKVLTFTLLLMGLSTFLIGALPTYGQVGIAAPILLVLLRLLQGLSAAGEQAGANSMTLEHAPAHRRAFFTSFTLSGTQMGFILATLVFLPISALPEDQLLSWGWRVPFFLSAIVVAVGFWIRRTLPETPAFEEEAKAHETPKLPVAELFREPHARRAARHLRRPGLGGQHDLRRVRALVRGQHDAHPALDACCCCWSAPTSSRWPRSRSGRRSPTGSAASPVFSDRRARLGGPDLADALGDLASADLTLIFVFGLLPVGRRLQRGERHLAVALRRDVRHPRAPLRHGHRHADRLRARRLRTDDQRRDPRRRAERLDAGGRLRHCRLRASSAISAFSARETYNVPMHQLGKRLALA